jgi:hypothetical protein
MAEERAFFFVQGLIPDKQCALVGVLISVCVWRAPHLTRQSQVAR